MFWVRIRLGGREYLGVLDTGATISIVAKKILPCGSLKNTMTTAAIRMGDGHVVHSCGDCEVEVPMGSRTIAHRFYVMDTEAFDFVLGTDFFVQHSQIQSLTLQAPYLLYVDHGSGRESVPLEQLEHTSSYLRLSKEEPSNIEKFIVFSALCFASPAACCWCRDSRCLFLEMKSFCFDEIQPLQVTPG